MRFDNHQTLVILKNFWAHYPKNTKIQKRRSEFNISAWFNQGIILTIASFAPLKLRVNITAVNSDFSLNVIL